MRIERLERNFLRWRTRGDARALERVFDRTAPELMALAAHLVRDPALAEDLVQQTFLVAIERAARFDEERKLVPWLIGILVREAHATRRREGRVVDADRLPPERQSDAVENASHLELSQALMNAIGELSESDRRILTPYLVEGRAPRDIAREEGMSPGAVRVRIHRSLDRLRGRLPAGLASGVGFAVLPRGLDTVRAQVMEAAAKCSVPAASVPITAAVGSIRGIAVACAALAVGGAWMTVDALQPAESEPARVAAMPEAEVLAVDELPATELPVQDAARVLAVPEGPREQRAVIEARPLRARLAVQLSGLMLPAPPTAVIAQIEGEWMEVGQVTENGVTVIELPCAPSKLDAVLSVRVAPDGYREINAHARRAGEGGGWVVELPLALLNARIRGRIVLPRGFELDWEDVRVSLYARDRHPLLSGYLERGSVRCTEGGQFELELGAAEPGTLIVRAEGLGLAQQEVSFVDGPHLDVGEIELHAGSSLSGVALYRGLPLRAGKVVAWSRVENLHPLFQSTADVGWDGERFRHTKSEARVGRHGSFRVVGLQPGEYELSVVPEIDGSKPRYHHIAGDGVLVEAPAENLRIESRLRVLEVEVRDADGPLKRASVRRGGQSGGMLDLGEIFGGGVNGEGRSELWVHPDADLKLEVLCPGYESKTLEYQEADLPLNSALVVVLQRVAKDTELTLLFDDPASVEGVRVGVVMLSAENGVHYLWSAKAHDGRALLPEVPPGEYQATFSLQVDKSLPPDRQSYARFVGTRLPDVDERGPTLNVPMKLGGRMRLHLSGLGPEAPELVLVHAGKQRDTPYLVPRGEHGTDSVTTPQPGIPSLLGRVRAPGRWIVRQVGDAYEESEVEVQVRAGETVDVFLALKAR